MDIHIEEKSMLSKKKGEEKPEDLLKGNNLFCKYDNLWPFGIMSHTLSIIFEWEEKWHRIYCTILKYALHSYGNKSLNSYLKD